MKQFSLEEYLANPKRKVVTRDGRNVRVICTDKKSVCPIVALITTYNGTAEEVITYTKDGKYFEVGSREHDLFFVPEKHEGWVNVYKAGITRSTGTFIWPTEEYAKKMVSTGCIATIKIEWEE